MVAISGEGSGEGQYFILLLSILGPSDFSEDSPWLRAGQTRSFPIHSPHLPIYYLNFGINVLVLGAVQHLGEDYRGSRVEELQPP